MEAIISLLMPLSVPFEEPMSCMRRKLTRKMKVKDINKKLQYLMDSPQSRCNVEATSRQADVTTLPLRAGGGLQKDSESDW